WFPLNRAQSKFHEIVKSEASTARYTLQYTPTAPTFSSVTTTSFRVTTTDPVNLTSGSSGVIFHDGSADRAKVIQLYEDLTGLTPNAQYTFKAKGVNGDGIATDYSSPSSGWTLSVPPTVGTVTTDQSNPARVNWSAVNGFGAGKVQYYRYAFDQSPTHSWTGSEPQWSSGALPTLPTAGGTWYLHVQGYNGANVANGAHSYAVEAPSAPAVTAQPQPQLACAGATATFSVAASGTSPGYAWYRHANLGWGSAWSASGGGGTFVDSSAANNNGEANCNAFSTNGDINTPGGSALGIVGGGTGLEGVTRSFPSALTSGQILRLDMDNGSVDSGQDVGFTLQNSSGATLMGVKFTGGGGIYEYYDLNSDHDTGIGFTRHGLRVQVLVGSGGTFALFITPCGGSTSGFIGTFANSGDPARLLLYNNNYSSGDVDKAYFNTIIVGTAYDDADNYSGDWNGQDKGDQQISGENGTTYATATGSNGDQYYAMAYNRAGPAVSSLALLTLEQSPLKWIGGNGSWDFATTGLWQDSTPVAAMYCDGYQVLWDDSATELAPAVTLNATVAAAGRR
ncbi:MAG TPA: hypothetical protein PKI20_20420, partial [Verrucomicrobiota bacterium]|nr:hypothetical protein [Verrucomicrobiota bacterium]